MTVGESVIIRFCAQVACWDGINDIVMSDALVKRTWVMFGVVICAIASAMFPLIGEMLLCFPAL